MTYTFTAKVWLWSHGKKPASWHFVTLPVSISEEILRLQQDVPKEQRRGRGSVKVEVHIGYVKRKTSVFPDKKLGAYVLPLKKEVREELHLKAEDEVTILLTTI